MIALPTKSSASCARCGCTTTVPQLLRPSTRFSLFKKRSVRLVCPRCTSKEERAGLYTLYGLCVLMILLATGTLVFKPMDAHDREPWMDYTSLMIAVLIVEPTMVVFHEVAHAAMGWAVGLRLFGISLGSGPRLWRWRGVNFFLDVHAVPAGGLCWIASKTDRVSRWRLAVMVAAGPMVHVIALVVLGFGGGALFRSAPRFAFGFWPVFLGINLIMLVGNLIPHDIQRNGWRYWNDGKLLLRLLSPKYDDTQWITGRYVMEIEACLEMDRVADARHWLERARPLTELTLMFRIIELHVLASESNWPEIQAKAGKGLSETREPLERWPWAAWAAIACVYTGGDLSLAEELSDEATSVVPWDPASQTVRATIFLAQARDADAEVALNQAGFMNSAWAAKTAAAQAWTELYRRLGDEPRRLKWKAIADTLDPRGVFKVPGTAIV